QGTCECGEGAVPWFLLIDLRQPSSPCKRSQRRSPTALKSFWCLFRHQATNDRDHHKVRYEVFRGKWLIRTDERKAELKARNWKPLKDKNPYGMHLVRVLNS
ncbi:MAG: hypothetical protein NTZ54_17385, partial [Alphaproteobacteria bacterium]|nr:hypothetical protein [Alphaproteobacteria bacterium]